MAINLIGFAVGKAEAERQGLQPAESTRIGVISSMIPNPLMALAIGRTLGKKAAQATPAGPTGV